jgi:hypothetical protein
MFRVRQLIFGFGAAALLCGATVTTPAEASVLSAQWFDISQLNTDVERTIDGVTTGLVLPNLGPDGLPGALSLFADIPAVVVEPHQRRQRRQRSPVVDSSRYRDAGSSLSEHRVDPIQPIEQLVPVWVQF